MKSEAGGDPPRYPDLFMVGFGRCGTTFLYNALRSHPDIFMPAMKEPHFLASDMDAGTSQDGRYRIRDEQTYLRLFAGARPGQIVGEASTSYILSSVAPAAIARVSPEARAIVTLRDPVDQIASVHGLRRNVGWEDLDLAEALDAEPERARGSRIPRLSVLPRFALYTHAASYGRHLERLFSHIPPERTIVVYLDDLATDPPATVRRITRWLGLTDQAIAETIERNESRPPRSRRLLEVMASPRTIEGAKRLTPRRLHPVAGGLAKRIFRGNRRSAPRPPMAVELRDRLRAQLRPELELASSLLGVDLVARWWKECDSA